MTVLTSLKASEVTVAMMLPVERFLEYIAVRHGAVCLREGVGLVLDAEHGQILLPAVLHGPLSAGCYTDDRSFTDGKDFAIDLVQAFTLEDDVKLLMGLMDMEESAVLAWDQRLETQLAACRTDGLADEDFPMEDSRSHREFIADDLIP